MLLFITWQYLILSSCGVYLTNSAESLSSCSNNSHGQSDKTRKHKDKTSTRNTNRWLIENWDISSVSWHVVRNETQEMAEAYSHHLPDQHGQCGLPLHTDLQEFTFVGGRGPRDDSLPQDPVPAAGLHARPLPEHAWNAHNKVQLQFQESFLPGGERPGLVSSLQGRLHDVDQELRHSCRLDSGANEKEGYFPLLHASIILRSCVG